MFLLSHLIQEENSKDKRISFWVSAVWQNKILTTSTVVFGNYAYTDTNHMKYVQYIDGQKAEISGIIDRIIIMIIIIIIINEIHVRLKYFRNFL